MRLNKSSSGTGPRTHEGATAVQPRSNIAALRQTVAGCLLWEDQFYEEGEKIADRIIRLAAECKPEDVAALAIEARQDMGLRHAPLLLLLSLFGRTPRYEGARAAVKSVVKRADELAEILSIYWRNGRKPIPAALKRGLADAFRNFDEYQLAKYDRPEKIKLRDVLKLVRPKPDTPEQAALWGRLKEGKLKTPDTWEVGLSAGGDKKEVFERLLDEGNLGGLALLRNLRNMDQAKVDRSKVNAALKARKGFRGIFPFRFIAAAKAAPEFEPAIDESFLAEMAQRPKLPGRTVVVIDVSGSMNFGQVSAKSDMTRIDAACALGAIARELCEDPVIYATAGSDSQRKHATAKVPARRGMALAEAVRQMPRSIGGGGIFTKQVCDFLRKEEGEVDRMIVITDEQDCGIGKGDSPLDASPIGKINYMINVSSYDRKISRHDRWVALTGFSENVFKYMLEAELVATKNVKATESSQELEPA